MARADTVLPGLIDAHTHTWSRSFLREALVYGRGPLNWTCFTDITFMHSIEERKVRGQGTSTSPISDHRGPWSQPLVGSWNGIRTKDSHNYIRPEQAKQFVDDRIAEGSDYIKIIYDDGPHLWCPYANDQQGNHGGRGLKLRTERGKSWRSRAYRFLNKEQSMPSTPKVDGTDAHL